MRSKLSLLLILLLMAPWLEIDAYAHSFPEEQHPAAGQTLATPPGDVQIKFDAPIEQLFAKLQVIGPDGKNYAVGEPKVSSDGIELTAQVTALKPGEYTVKWAVVCVDTHHTEGSYTFTITGGGA